MYTRSLRIIKTKEPYTYTLVQLIFWTLVWFVDQKGPVESQKRILYFIDYTKKLIEVLNSYIPAHIIVVVLQTSASLVTGGRP